jgi:gas vesicle protein
MFGGKVVACILIGAVSGVVAVVLLLAGLVANETRIEKKEVRRLKRLIEEAKSAQQGK